MKTISLLILIAFTFVSCNNSNAEKANNETVESSGNETKNDPKSDSKKSSTNGFWQKLVMRDLKNKDGSVFALMPMPASWKFSNMGGITGPNGLKITDFPGQNFMINYNQNIQYTYDQSGQRMRELPEMQQLIQEDFVPWGNKNGLQFVKHYELPEVAKMDKWYSDQLFKALPSRSDVRAYGTEWKTKNGDPYFLLIHLNVSTSETLRMWYYYSTGLESDPAYFDAARKTLIFGLANMRYNIEPIQKYNKTEAERCGKSWAAFNQRMAKNQADFEASQRAFVNKSDAINDAIMSGWKARNDASDKNQEQFIDNVYERRDVQNTTTGKTYKVQEGANQYWMNSDGEYIGTKLQGYDPNYDDNMNEKKWDELKQIKK